MDLELKNKLVLVTGSTSGIGKAIAKKFAQEGAQVIVNGRSAETVEAAVADLKKTDARISGIVADLSTLAGATQLGSEIKKLGVLDILINNVGIFEVKDFESVTDEEWFHYFDVNVMSAVRLSRMYLPAMLQRNTGRVLFIASEAGVKPLPQMIHYSVTKTALIGLARGLAELTKGTSVTVNSMLIGPTWTEGVEKYFKGLAEMKQQNLDSLVQDYFKKNEPTSLIQRFVEVDEVAKAVVLTCANGAINGSAQRVEGGIIRSIL